MVFFQLLQIFAQSVYFFHPLVWLLNERVNEYREMACDDTAIKQANLSPMEYSRYLVHMAENVVSPHWSYSSATALIRQKNKLTNRVNYILKEAAMKRSSPKIVGIVLLLLVVIVAPLSLYSSKPKEPPEPHAPSTSELDVPGPAELLESGPTLSSEPPEPVGPLETENVGPIANDEAESSTFVVYDEPPSPIGGFAAIQKKLRYPAIARKAGVEGRVYVNVLVDVNGEVKETKNLKSLGNNGCDEAAAKAIKSVKWTPAKSRGESVAVWVGIPVVFKLDSKNAKSKKVDIQLKETIVNTDNASDEEEFVAYDEPPSPIGGFVAIQKNLHYPEIARKAGVEGRIILNVLVDVNGEVKETKILKTLGDNGCDEAAIKAIKSVKWTPAKNRGESVAVWVGIPVVFKLDGKNAKSTKVDIQLKEAIVNTDNAPDEEEFVAYDEPPHPIGGFKELQRWVYYPEIPRKTGVEGRVYVNVLINETGEVEETKVLKSLGDNGCDEAAVEAITKVKWEPAKKDNKPVKVWVGIPVVFKLK
jgi:TonB family protein